MRDRRRLWARAAAVGAAVGFALALAVVGWIVGHAGAYALVEPAHRSARLDSAHSYMTPLTFSTLVVALLTLLAFAAAARGAPRGTPGFWSRSPAPAALAVCALVPSLVYVLAELAEYVSVGELPAVPTLLVGLLFQLPLGPLAALAAHRLLRGIERLVGRTARRARFSGGSPRWFPRAAEPVRLRPLAGAIAGRAPPPGG